MEFQQLEMFAALVEEGSVSGAAERVCRTPPAVSIAIRKLEEELGIRLFDRSERHNQQLTASGKLLYSYATRLLLLRQETIGSIRDLQGQLQTLRLGTHESTSLYLLPSLMQSMNLLKTGFKMEVVCGTTDQLLRALDNRALELALIGDAPEDERFMRHLIFRDELVLITSSSHRLVGLRVVRVRDLAGESLIVQGSKSRLRGRIIKALQDSAISFRLGVENVAIEAIKRLVVEGSGIGLVPHMCIRDEVSTDKLAIIKIKDLLSDWDISLVYRKDRYLSAAARAFVEGAMRFETRTSVVCSQQNLGGNAVPQGPESIASQRKVIHC